MLAASVAFLFQGVLTFLYSKKWLLDLLNYICCCLMQHHCTRLLSCKSTKWKKKQVMDVLLRIHAWYVVPLDRDA
jgi:hypothetical protein